MTMGITIITTAEKSGKRWDRTSCDGNTVIGNAVKIVVDSGKRNQKIEGFGGAFTDTAAAALRQMEPSLQVQALQKYFDPHVGLGYNAGRVPIGSCDFSRELYSYDDCEGDTALEHFCVDRDLNGVIPFILDAQKTAGDCSLDLYALPWSPPAWMKTNRSMLNGGKLKREYYPTMAAYIGRFVDAYQKKGIPIHAVTAQNEPNEIQKWPSCIYTAEEEQAFLHYLIPEMRARDVEVLCWDCNKDFMRSRVEFLMRDDKIRPYIDGVGFHWYSGGFYEELGILHREYPELQLCATECCVVMPDDLSDWSVGERYAYDMIENFNHGASVWLDWNLYLDEESGPKLFENPCAAPIILDRKRQKLVCMSSYYYIGHLSRYISKGAVQVESRVEATLDGTGLVCCAFQNPDGGMVAVVMNSGGQQKPVCMEIQNQRCCLVMEEHSIATILFSLDC